MSAALKPTAAASHAKRERQEQRRAEMQPTWAGSQQVRARLGKSEKTIQKLPIKRIKFRRADGTLDRNWSYYWPDVLAYEEKMLEEATKYQERMS